jgi:hypothetical protein
MTVQLCGTKHSEKENISKAEDERIGGKNEVIVLCYAGNSNLRDNTTVQSYVKIPISQVEYSSNSCGILRGRGRDLGQGPPQHYIISCQVGFTPS